MDGDCPAAHSMDTTWFAVDRDGHVGQFSSGENGHVPLAARWTPHDFVSWQGPDALALSERDRHPDPFDSPAPLVHKQIVLAEPDRFLGLCGADGVARHTPPRSDPRDQPVVLYLRRLDRVHGELVRGRAVAAPAGRDLHVVVMDNLFASLHKRIHREEACAGCFDLGWPVALHLGLYWYSDGDTPRRTYRRYREPGRPLHVGSLPPLLALYLESVRYDSFDFAQTEVILPLAHHPVDTRGTCYLDADNTLRPVPGHEDAYRRNYAELLEWARQEGWQVAPPPGGGPDYPAAHSMDVLWFAVDRDGAVACFRTGSAAAIPRGAGGADAGNPDWVCAGIEEIDALEYRSPVVLDLEGLVVPPLELPRHLAAVGSPGALFFLTSTEAVRDELAAGHAVEVLSRPAGAVLLRVPLGEGLWRRLHERGECRACFAEAAGLELLGGYFSSGMFQYFDPFPQADEYEPPLPVFRHEELEWCLSGLYARLALPARPLDADRLPRGARQLVQRVQFDGLSFAATPHLDPGGFIWSPAELARRREEMHRRMLDWALDLAAEAERRGQSAAAAEHFARARDHDEKLRRLTGG